MSPLDIIEMAQKMEVQISKPTLRSLLKTANQTQRELGYFGAKLMVETALDTLKRESTAN